MTNKVTSYFAGFSPEYIDMVLPFSGKDVQFNGIWYTERPLRRGLILYASFIIDGAFVILVSKIDYCEVMTEFWDSPLSDDYDSPLRGYTGSREAFTIIMNENLDRLANLA